MHDMPHMGIKQKKNILDLLILLGSPKQPF